MLQGISLCHASHVGVTSVCPSYLQFNRFSLILCFGSVTEEGKNQVGPCFSLFQRLSSRKGRETV